MTSMQSSSELQQKVQELAGRYGVSQDSVRAMAQAVANGNGTMAQFNIPELGGYGQWMQGGMTMVGDMFNHSLQAKVTSLCGELALLISTSPSFATSVRGEQRPGAQSSASKWWPAYLGEPSSSGAQNTMKYAYFSTPLNRLAIEINGVVSIYDALDHQISGVSQQQGSAQTLKFNSQHGEVAIQKLPLLSGKGV